LLAGDSQTGVTIMQMDVGLDTGPMLLARTTPIGSDDTASSLHDRLAQMGAQALLETIDGLLDGSIAPRAQPSDGATYAAKIRKEEASIDWTRSAAQLDRQVRAFNPWPVAETRWNGQQLRVWQAHPLQDSTPAAPGTLLGGDASGIRVATGSGVLNLTRVQLAGRKAVSAAEFLNAQRLDGASLA
jgi:methionyl-tRNA formyltransferase